MTIKNVWGPVSSACEVLWSWELKSVVKVQRHYRYLSI